MFNNIGPREGTEEHSTLEDEIGFNYRNVLGELMYAYITAQLDIGCAITLLSKFSSFPSKCHYQYLKGVALYL